ncbi:MAG: VanZ family protein [Deltaproteobacteria bacterium]|nr:VanZ family protein [Deltaproteobacteria bacterium]
MNGLKILAQVIWVISIFLVSYLSLMPRIDLPQTFSGTDKIAHFLAYFWLSAIPFFGFSEIKRAVKAALWMIGLGIGLEFGQLWVPGRQLSFFDMVANSAGVTLGILLMRDVVRPHLMGR